METKPIPTIESQHGMDNQLADSSWADKVIEQEAQRLRDQLDLVDQRLRLNPNGFGGSGVLDPPNAGSKIARALREAARGDLSQDVLDTLQDKISSYQPLIFPEYLALFRVQWRDLDEFFEFARNYMLDPKWELYRQDVLDTLETEE